MVRDGCLPDRKTVAEPAAANLSLFRDVFEYLEAARIGQCFGDPLELLCVHGLSVSSIER